MRDDVDLDLEGLKPGSVIDESTCEQVIGIRRKDDQYQFQFELMRLADFIQRSLWKAGNQWTVKISSGEILVLTHEAASKYNAKQFMLALAKLRRANRRLAAVDVGELSKESRQQHIEEIAKQSRMLAGLSQKRASDDDLRPTPVKRTVPLGGPAKE